MIIRFFCRIICFFSGHQLWWPGSRERGWYNNEQKNFAHYSLCQCRRCGRALELHQLKFDSYVWKHD